MQKNDARNWIKCCLVSPLKLRPISFLRRGGFLEFVCLSEPYEKSCKPFWDFVQETEINSLPTTSFFRFSSWNLKHVSVSLEMIPQPDGIEEFFWQISSHKLNSQVCISLVPQKSQKDEKRRVHNQESVINILLINKVLCF